MIVEGINVVRELLKADVRIEKIIAENTDNKDVVNLTDLAKAKGVCVEIVDKQKLERIAKQKTQGIIAFVENYKYCEVKDILLAAERKDEKPFIVILDGITDPHNLGAIIRTCECAGVHGIIIPENRACEVNNTVYKTSAGAIVHMPVSIVTNLTRTINELKKQNIWVYAMEAGNKKVYKADFTYPTAIVIGSDQRERDRFAVMLQCQLQRTVIATAK